MRNRIAFAAIGLLAVGGLVTAIAVPAQQAEAAATPKVELKPIQPVHPLDGVHLYTAYCSDCHGEKGRGDGPLADRLGVPIPDLTQLAGESGEFRRGEVRRAIAKSHMIPVEEAENWHDVLVGSFGSQRGELILTQLVRHLETLQP